MVVMGRVNLEEEQLTGLCKNGTNIDESIRNEKSVRANLLKRARLENWMVPTLDTKTMQEVDSRPFSQRDADKVPIYIINQSQAPKCWDTNKKGCWKVPDTDKDGNYRSGADYDESDSESVFGSDSSFNGSDSGSMLES